ncbi:hypothetical protein B296_00032765 [Ensete ventricosum]|uniref:Uncharacterized protein n=1 Tax=Ensete ventricosum TaxID=4639 RepID=A0A426ZEA2_ENSVE|nr:hypothetical protein B296_00032765 [Ensete ventricosum]
MANRGICTSHAYFAEAASSCQIRVSCVSGDKCISRGALGSCSGRLACHPPQAEHYPALSLTLAFGFCKTPNTRYEQFICWRKRCSRRKHPENRVWAVQLPAWADMPPSTIRKPG